MIRPRRLSALIIALSLIPSLRAQNNPPLGKPPSPWAIDRSLTVSPTNDTVPALKYRLLPPSWEMRDGNAVPIYLRLVHEQNDALRKYWTETPQPWNDLPIDKIPLAEAHNFLDRHRYMLRQLELGARRRTADWNYTTEEPNPIGLLLPDCQVMRSYAPMLALQARVAIAEGDFAKAVHHMETGLAFSRHIAEGPTLIHSLVGFAVAKDIVSALADLVEQSGSPNLYWALTSLPRPFIDLHAGLAFEYKTAENQFPDLADLKRERTPEQWDAALRNLRTVLLGLAKEGETGKSPEWFPMEFAADAPASKSAEFPEARKFVARAKGMSAEKVEALPPAQVFLLYLMGTYEIDRDDWHRAVYLPYPQARRVCESALKRLHDAPVAEGHLLARLLLPGLDRVMWRQNLFDRNLAALRVVEALRIFAAAHDGKLPDKLDNATEVPIPVDPGTGRPFGYSRDGDTATLISQIPGDEGPQRGIRYRVTIRKK